MQLNKRHLSICIGLLFSYESGCMNFKTGNNVSKTVSLGGIFRISVLDFVSHDFLSSFCLESDSHCFAWRSSLTEPFFSLPVVCVCVSSRYCCGVPIPAAAVYADTLGTGTGCGCWEWERWVRAAREWLAEQRVISLRDSESDRQFKFEGKTAVRKRKQESFSMCNDAINQQNGPFWWHR